MTERGVMVLMNGMVLDRERSWHRSDAPARDGHELSELDVRSCGAAAATLMHPVRAHRGADPAFEAVKSSTCVLQDGRVRLSLHQQTTATPRGILADWQTRPGRR